MYKLLFVSAGCQLQGGKGPEEEVPYKEVVAMVGTTVILKCETIHKTYDFLTWWRNDSKKIVAQKHPSYEHVSYNFLTLNFSSIAWFSLSLK